MHTQTHTHTHTHTAYTIVYVHTQQVCTILIQGDSFLTSASYNGSTHFQETEGGLLIYTLARPTLPGSPLARRERHSQETEESKYGSVLKYHFDTLLPKMSISTHFLPLLSEGNIVLFTTFIQIASTSTSSIG